MLRHSHEETTFLASNRSRSYVCETWYWPPSSLPFKVVPVSCEYDLVLLATLISLWLRLITLTEVTLYLFIVITLLLYIERILSFSLRHKKFSKFVQLFLFLRFSQFLLFHVISKQLLCHLRRPFCVCESLSSTTFSMPCSVNEANLEVMYLLLHWRQATQSARTWHYYPQKSCTAVIHDHYGSWHDMVTRDLECPWHDCCIICSYAFGQSEKR